MYTMSNSVYIRTNIYGTITPSCDRILGLFFDESGEPCLRQRIESFISCSPAKARGADVQVRPELSDDGSLDHARQQFETASRVDQVAKCQCEHNGGLGISLTMAVKVLFNDTLQLAIGACTGAH